MEGGASDLSEAEMEMEAELPEDCVAILLALASPCDGEQLSSVSSAFPSIDDSDAFWRRFLPPDYESILARSADSSSYLRSLPPKELYFSLCSKPILIDDGMKSFSLDRCTGKKCYMLSARELGIVWGDTPEYWKWTSYSNPKSRFSEVAVLLDVCWLEISGRINVEILSPATRYAAFLVFSWDGAAHGFNNQRADVTVGLVGSQPSVRTVYLDAKTLNAEQKKRRDGWWEIKLGEFTTGEGVEGVLEMRLFGAHGGHWKGGLVVHGIEIRPKD